MTPNVAASVKARLLARARADREEFERTLVRYAAERLLYRLGASSARDRCLLKGAGLLAVWLSDPYRATRDVDLLAFGASDEAATRALVEEICAVPCPEDGLRFDLSGMTVETIRAEEEYAGRRVRFTAYLEKTRISVQVDVGIGDVVGAERDEIEFPVMLEHLPAPRLRAYRRPTSIAEKLDATLNTEGGDLLVGVADDRTVLGIEHDRLESDDRFMRHLAQVVRNGLGDRASTCIDPNTQIVDGKTVCLVSCQRSPEPVFLRWKGMESDPRGDFCVRSGPGTVRLGEEDTEAYIRTRFRQGSDRGRRD